MTRWTARLSLALVAAIAAVASYLHALVVVQAADGVAIVAYFIPLLADLVIASAAANILDAARTSHPRPRWSLVAVGVGIVVTLGSNVMYGYPHDVPSWLVNGWPPVAFGLALESITGMVSRGRRNVSETYVSGPAGHDQPPEPPDLDAALAALAATYSQRAIAAALGIPRSRVATWAARAATPPASASAAAPNGASPDGNG